LALPDADIVTMKERAAKFSLTELIRLVEQFAELSKDFDSQLAQRIALEAPLIRISKVSVEMSVDAVLEKLVLLGAGGISSSAPERPPANPKPAARPAASPKAQTRRTTSDNASGAPAPTVQPLEITNANLASEWPRIAQAAAQHSLNLGVWLGHANPLAIDNETLLLQFGRDQAQARNVVLKPENVKAIEETLRSVTRNLKTFRCEIIEAAPNGNGSPSNGSKLKVTKETEEYRAAMADPHVAKVVDIFKGRIVDIKVGKASKHPEHESAR